MKSKNVLYTLLVVILMLALAMVKLRNEPIPKELFNRKPNALSFTEFALCRMSCGQISKKEIKEVMARGVINLNKSDKRDRPCPTYALQSRTIKGHYLRVVFAQCEGETKVVNCYDLERAIECYCTGDES